ncbi:HK97 family phage prohead protease [Romboutsia timonensis]|uniref:HK97 family phage prohead protease n=1 Tax=Romboutsia timonensis TaxID=1776391 RepID=UPI002A82A970|nr:HK97 family phage prohead protease [Romboutsia timonensis]MDY3960175.1 HK97 family phage prohead protease [Romboutsia timonensis]
MMKIEVRSDSVVLEGYVNVTMRDSRVLSGIRGKFIEVVEARTFTKAIERANNIQLLHNHKKDRILGSTSNGNLELREDNIGLFARCEIRDQEVMNKAKNGELKGWSFGFSTIKDRWEKHDSGIDRRYLEDINLYEISILDVTPAYYATSVEVRGEENTLIEERSCESTIELITTEKVDEKRAEKLVETDLSALFDVQNFIKIRK